MHVDGAVLFVKLQRALKRKKLQFWLILASFTRQNFPQILQSWNKDREMVRRVARSGSE